MPLYTLFFVPQACIPADSFSEETHNDVIPCLKLLFEPPNNAEPITATAKY